MWTFLTFASTRELFRAPLCLKVMIPDRMKTFITQLKTFIDSNEDFYWLKWRLVFPMTSFICGSSEHTWMNSWTSVGNGYTKYTTPLHEEFRARFCRLLLAVKIFIHYSDSNLHGSLGYCSQPCLWNKNLQNRIKIHRVE